MTFTVETSNVGQGVDGAEKWFSPEIGARTALGPVGFALSKVSKYGNSFREAVEMSGRAIDSPGG